jgi:hypothetical protein
MHSSFSPHFKDSRNSDTDNSRKLAGKIAGLLTPLIAAQLFQLPATAKMPTERSHYIQSGAAYAACRNYQARNTWVGGLVNARHIGWWLYGCDFTKVCVRVNSSGQQAANFPVTGSQIAKKLETEASFH